MKTDNRAVRISLREVTLLHHPGHAVLHFLYMVVLVKCYHEELMIADLLHVLPGSPDLFSGLRLEQDPLSLQDLLQVGLHLPDGLVQLLGGEDARAQGVGFLEVKRMMNQL